MTTVDTAPQGLALRQSRQALDRVQTDPVTAERQAKAVLRRSTTGEARVVALWAYGRARYEQGDPSAAGDILGDAVRLASASGLHDHAAQIRVSRSVCLMTIGASTRALRELTLAQRVLAGAPRARARTQRGLLLARLGRLDDALHELVDAEPDLRDTDALGLTRLLLNRGALRVLLGHLADAARDLDEGERLALDLEQHLLVARARHSQAFLDARRGDIPRALQRYEQAAADYARFGAVGDVAPTLDPDRCELYLAGGLVAEATDAASRALDAAVHATDVLVQAEARLLLARAKLAAGDYAAAAHHADEAAGLFRRSRRASWAALARYVAIQAEIVSMQDRERPPARLVGKAARIADQLAELGWSTEAMHVRTFVGRMSIALGRLDDAQRVLAAAGDARVRGPADLRASSWHATALLRYAAGDRRGARRALASGFAVLDEHRALLGASELRARAASHGAELSRLGLRMALTDGRPRDVLTWAERTRAAALRLPPVRPPDDGAMVELLARWRQAAQDAREAASDGERADIRSKVVALEQAIRATARLAAGPGVTGEVSCDVAALVERLVDRALVEFVELEGRLWAVVVADGRVSLRVVGPMPAIVNEIDFLRFHQQRLAVAAARDTGAATALARFASSAGRLDDHLLAPLGLVGGRELVIVPTGVLHAVPWHALPRLHDRIVTVTPSAALWCRAPRPAAPGGARRPVALVAGPALPGGDDEVRKLARRYPGAVELTGAAATIDATLAACEHSDLVHLAAHGDFRADSPLFSSLRLADGQLTVYDLERLRAVPRSMVLPACDAAAADVQAGDELLGTASALLTLGVRTIIAPVAKIPDRATTNLSLDLHRGLRAGRHPSAALADACRRARERGGPADHAAAAALLCIGADDRG